MVPCCFPAFLPAFCLLFTLGAMTRTWVLRQRCNCLIPTGIDPSCREYFCDRASFHLLPRSVKSTLLKVPGLWEAYTAVAGGRWQQAAGIAQERLIKTRQNKGHLRRDHEAG
jgi:hypothetical protein